MAASAPGLAEPRSHQWQLTYQSAKNREPLTTAVLTPDGPDSFLFTRFRGALTVAAAPGNTGGNLRDLVWPQDSPAVTDSESCATWTSATTDAAQEGLALRIADNGPALRAITLTKNVIYQIYWVFNVHVWNSVSSTPYRQIAQFDLESLLLPNGTLEPFPWRVCARVVGTTLSMKIWFPDQMAQPSWKNPTYVFTTDAIPTEYVYPGATGWYAGHIPPAGSLTYSSLSTYERSAGRPD